MKRETKNYINLCLEEEEDWHFDKCDNSNASGQAVKNDWERI